MNVSKEDIQKLYELCKLEWHSGASENMRNACLTFEKLLDLEPFSFIGDETTARHKRQTHTKILSELGFKPEEPSKSQGKPDRISRYSRR